MLKKDEYIKTVRRAYPPLLCSMIMKGSSDPNHFKGVLSKKFSIKNLIKINEYFYYAKKELEQSARYTLQSWVDPKQLQKVKIIFLEREKEVIKLSKKLDFIAYSNAYEEYMAALVTVWPVENLVSEKVKKLLNKKMSDSKTQELMNHLNIPLWIAARYGEKKFYTVADAKKRKLKVKKAEYIRQCQENKKLTKDSIKKAESVLAKKDQPIIDLMQYIVYYRTQRTDIMNRSQYHFIKGFNKLAKSCSLTYKELLYCTKEEILNSMPSKKIIEQRLKKYAIILEDGNVSCVTGNEYNKVNKFIRKEINQRSKVNGVIASKGKIRGRAKIIFRSKEFSKMKKGDILITNMTTPQMVGIMQKAAAFVTDEGGITCHAAIISREMNKPCIMKTKIATQVFKDGDLLEVDANKGVVKKI